MAETLFSEENTEKEKSKKEHKYLKSLLAVLAIILFSAGAAGGVWYWQQSEIKKQRTELDRQVSELQKQLTDKAAEAVKTQAKDPDYLPMVTFSPATFSEKEKQEIKTKITDPMLFYKNEKELNTIVLIITKYAEDDRRAGYWYSLEEITKDGHAGGRLIGENGKIEPWKPECMGPCNLSNEYKTKFPNNISDQDL